jgi:hypothetical protein
MEYAMDKPGVLPDPHPARCVPVVSIIEEGAGRQLDLVV